MGLFGGGTVGFGSVSESSWEAVGCSTCEGAAPGFYVELDLGYRIRRRFAIVGAAGLVLHSDFDPEGGDTFDFKTLDTGIVGLGVQYWFSPRGSVRGLVGGGSATADVQLNGVDIEGAQAGGPGVMASLDYEVYERPRWSIGVQVDAGLFTAEEQTLSIIGVSMSMRAHATESPQ